MISINGTTMKGVRHDQAVALLTGHPQEDVYLVVQVRMCLSLSKRRRTQYTKIELQNLFKLFCNAHTNLEMVFVLVEHMLPNPIFDFNFKFL